MLVMVNSSASRASPSPPPLLPPFPSQSHRILSDPVGMRLRGGSSQAEVDEMLRTLINKSPIMLFMKGSPSQPQCGFSKQMVSLLHRHNIEFDHFDSKF